MGSLDFGKPRILILTPWRPLPFDAGSRRVWTACRSLADRYDFHLLTYHAPQAPPEAAPAQAARAAASDLARQSSFFRGVFREVTTVEQRDADVVSGPWPQEVRRFQTSRMGEALTRLLSSRRFDAVHVEFDLMAPYVWTLKERFPGLPCLLTHHDLGSVSFFRSYFREMTGWRRVLRLPDWARRVAFTSRACRRFDCVVVLTDADRRRLRWLAPGADAAVVPTGVDLGHFSSAPPRATRRPKSLVYVGHYPHYPNEDAVLWFARSILPLVWARDPEVEFQIVGTGPTAAIRELARDEPRIEVTGPVDDVRDYEEKAAVMVAPLRLGKGIKGKILEGMASGTPVVATSLANEGIGAGPGREILLADDAASFAAQLLRVLSDGALWDRLSEAGRAFVEARHSWTKRAEELDAVYRRVLKTSHGASTLLPI